MWFDARHDATVNKIKKEKKRKKPVSNPNLA